MEQSSIAPEGRWLIVQWIPAVAKDISVWIVGPLDWGAVWTCFNCAVYKYSYLLTYLLTFIESIRTKAHQNNLGKISIGIVRESKKLLGHSYIRRIARSSLRLHSFLVILFAVYLLTRSIVHICHVVAICMIPVLVYLLLTQQSVTCGRQFDVAAMHCTVMICHSTSSVTLSLWWITSALHAMVSTQNRSLMPRCGICSVMHALFSVDGCWWW